MVKRIKLMFIDGDTELSFSQPKSSYSHRELLKKLEQYKEALIK